MVGPQWNVAMNYILHLEVEQVERGGRLALLLQHEQRLQARERGVPAPILFSMNPS